MKGEILECAEGDDNTPRGLADPVIAVPGLAALALASATRASACTPFSLAPACACSNP